MTWKKPDGEIEIGHSGCCCPPGHRKLGQHTNATTSWVKDADGNWKRLHSLSRVMKMASESKTCREFYEDLHLEYTLRV